MPGFFSWVSGFFSSNGPSAPQAEPRLFNPVNHNSATSEQEIALVRHLEDHLFCWLLDSPPSELRADVPRMATTLNQLGERLATSSIEELPRQPMSLPMLMRALSDESSDRQRLGGHHPQRPRADRPVAANRHQPLFPLGRSGH